MCVCFRVRVRVIQTKPNRTKPSQAQPNQTKLNLQHGHPYCVRFGNIWVGYSSLIQRIFTHTNTQKEREKKKKNYILITLWASIYIVILECGICTDISIILLWINEYASSSCIITTRNMVIEEAFCFSFCTIYVRDLTHHIQPTPEPGKIQLIITFQIIKPHWLSIYMADDGPLFYMRCTNIRHANVCDICVRRCWKKKRTNMHTTKWWLIMIYLAFIN